MLLSAASQETQKADEPVVWVVVRSRPYFVRVRRRDITVSEDSAVVQLQAPGIAFSEANAAFAERALWPCRPWTRLSWRGSARARAP